ncbi:hypothetical protein DPX39_050006600 [Trypanosoma brucei equiperdum]|uniref:Uncharacterized protein n=2 Tax=Trypanosoma brucei TaxID=5691 RepID=B2ZWB6_TRYB2|nr:hypothetical protein DPX39_050006600 [Trypanosoma brucei equiperdum]CAQ55504.1 hypothetical protein Tb927.5.294b [Trypanosoma brucei brucei TREU927]
MHTGVSFPRRRGDGCREHIGMTCGVKTQRVYVELIHFFFYHGQLPLQNSYRSTLQCTRRESVCGITCFATMMVGQPSTTNAFRAMKFHWHAKCLHRPCLACVCCGHVGTDFRVHKCTHIAHAYVTPLFPSDPITSFFRLQAKVSSTNETKQAT